MRGLGPLPQRAASAGDGRRMRVSKEWMNRLVMDYLIGKGYRDVAEAFMRDSGTKPHVDLQSVQTRMRIHQLLLNGEIAKARDKLLHIDASFIDRNGSIGFLLAKQEMIELIKGGQVMAALTFATQHLAPFGEKNSCFLQEIEHTMALLAFENQYQSPLAYLLEPAQRRRVADEVNSAILRLQKQELEPMLPTMVRQYHFIEDQLQSKLHRKPRGISSAKDRAIDEETKE
ncbi:hypothetical protein PINS_up003889 [Pythium insidiosum]|nr:hypothetical protein PINS_up003889 [Pythium insidiosum]